MPRIYPSYQDTNTTAKGSLIISYYDIIPEAKEDYIQVTVNGILRDRDYEMSEGVYSTYLNVNDVVKIDMYTPSIFFKNITIYRKDYTTDDNNDYGIVDTYVGQLNNSTQTISLTFTATTLNDSYNFEYLVSGNIGTNPSVDCYTLGMAYDNDANYLLGNDGRYLKFSSQFPSPKPGPSVDYEPYETVVIAPDTIQNFTLNYYGNIINYVVNGYEPQYYIQPISYIIPSGVTFSSSTINYDPGKNWTNMDCSNDGKYQVVAQINGSMFVSSNSGITYTEISGSTKNWKKISMPNKNGYPFYAITSDNRDYIYKINSSSSITTLSSNARPPSGYTFTDFAVSRDNKYVVAVYSQNLTGNTIYYSTDSGSTFSSINCGYTIGDGPCVAMSSTGRYIYVGRGGGDYLYNVVKSNDFGASWSLGPTPNYSGNPTIINCSGTGKYVFVTGIYGTPTINISQDYLTSYNSQTFYDAIQLKPNKN